MIVSFDENVQERDCIVLFKFNGECDISVTVIEVVQELGCCVFIVEQGEGIVDGVAMGSPLGPILANIFMCHFFNNNARPSVWFRYVDDTFTLKCL